MNLLAIDTSTECASVGLLSQGTISHLEQPAQRQHAAFILPMIEQLLQAAKLTIGQLDGIVFGRGPGSFTGLRIACSVAKGLAYAHDLPLYPVSSLSTIAHDARLQAPPNTSTGVLAMIDARMQQIYWACYSPENHMVHDEQVSSADTLHIDNDFPLLLAGVGAPLYREQLPSSIRSRIIGEVEIYPNAKAMLRLAMEGALHAVDAIDAIPVYIRNQIVQGDTRG